MPPSILANLVFIDSAGYHFADFPTFLSALTTAYQNIYGVDVYLQPDSQDGQFLGILAQAFYDTAALGASVYNSFSPLTAQGVGLSRVVKINGLTRLSASFSTVTLTVTGTAGTVITNGVAADTLNQQWLLPSTVTIPNTGTINVLAVSAVIGFVTAAMNTVTTIFTPTLGWQTVNNAAAATPGAAVETDAALRIRQSLSTAIPAQTPFDAAIGRVGNVVGVTKVQGYENFTNTTNGIGLTAHSINITTVGGASTDIANAIVSGKTPGTDTVGNTGPILVYDAKGMPLNIFYSVAITAEIQVTIGIHELPGWSDNYLTQIKNAVAAYINSLPIGTEIFSTSLYTPASLIGTPAAGTFAFNSAITIGLNGGGQSTNPIVLQQGLQNLGRGVGAENPVCNASVDVTINAS